MDSQVVIEKFELVRDLLQKRERTLASIGMCVVALLLGYHVFTGSNGIRVYTQKRAENQKLQQEMEQLKKENENLTQSVRSLKSDPNAIEKEAREQLRYAKPGEVIFVVPEQKRPAPPNSASNQVIPAKP